MSINNDIWYTTLTKVLDRQKILDEFLDSSIPQILPEIQMPTASDQCRRWAETQLKMDLRKCI